MRRFLTLLCLLGLSIPAGVSISGCFRNPQAKYCNGLGYGLQDTQVASITLQPQIAGISLAYGQTQLISPPSALTCKGEPAGISSNNFNFGTTNNQLVDISPGGNICAGTWNRNTGGGIADYTTCNFPNPAPSTAGLPYAIGYITATADAVTSNPIAVYVHAPISSMSLVTTPLAGAPAQGCFSQNQQAQLDAEAFYSLNGLQTPLCAPNSATLPKCSNSVGTLGFTVQTSAVASIDPTTNIITAQQPGTTEINSSIAQTTSSAGHFSTCPPASIAVTLANGSTSGVITQGVTQNLTAKVVDTQGNPIAGLNLSYQSTNPIDIAAASGGGISAQFPGSASVYAICQPPSCNPAPINELGLFGTGLSLASNPVNIVVPGATSDFLWFGAPGQSQYFASVELLTGAPGSTVRLPYVPNSMVADQRVSSLYFGSQHGLMVYSTATNGLVKADASVPGLVLAVAPSSGEVLINDQVRGLFYLYNVSAGQSQTQSGLGVAAAWTPDSSTLYIVDSSSLGGAHTDTLYVFNSNTGWSTYPLAAPPAFWAANSPAIGRGVAITVPSVGAYLSGNPTVAHAWCPGGVPPNPAVVGNNATIAFYPQSDSLPNETEVLAATSGGNHILGASLNGNSINLTDIGVTISTVAPNAVCPGVGPSAPAQGGTLFPLTTKPVVNGPLSLTAVTNAAIVNQVVTGVAPSTASVTTAAPIAFVTYTPNASAAVAQLPYYLPQSSGAGTLGYVTFADSTSATPPTAPLAGAFSPDNTTFFVSTSGDNEIHFIAIPLNLGPSSPPTDTQQFSPNLPGCDPAIDAGCLFKGTPGTIVPATAIAVRPRAVT